MEVRRKQREEEQRILREREKLAMERLQIAKERAELLRMERDNQISVKQKIEHERRELNRKQLTYNYILFKNFLRSYQTF